MNYLKSIFTLFLGFIINTAHCQNEFKTYNIGGGLHYVSVFAYSTIPPLNSSSPKLLDTTKVGQYAVILPSVYFTWNIPIIKVTDRSAIGINPGLQLMGGMRNGNGYIGFATPVFLTYKLGTDAILTESAGKLGFALGLGYQLSAVGGDDFEFYFKTPAYFLEFSFLSNENINKIRFFGLLGQHNDKFEFMHVELDKYYGLMYISEF